jgi:hypothetical protein
MSDHTEYPFVIYLTAYKKINGQLAYVENAINVEMLRDFGGHFTYILGAFDKKFKELEKAAAKAHDL